MHGKWESGIGLGQGVSVVGGVGRVQVIAGLGQSRVEYQQFVVDDRSDRAASQPRRQGLVRSRPWATTPAALAPSSPTTATAHF